MLFSFFALIVLTSSCFLDLTAAIRLHAVGLSSHLTVASDDAAILVTKHIAAAAKDIERQVPALDGEFNDFASQNGSADNHKGMMLDTNLASSLEANDYTKEIFRGFHPYRRHIASDCPTCVPPYFPGTGGGGGIGNP
ncbi:hypothetical protein O6H91_02G128400 [Diphasiastrum complanatum]|uniref:Uncharacterized protein n=1 Tax=Diphasiastrum complanatum TaxID=34168 RepID=A0ACC2EKJ2_DIPCM|nr:hypothetical protein O6H91_02G128400 [Diphasiastrum complanatum]